jgi:hypothetical protein
LVLSRGIIKQKEVHREGGAREGDGEREGETGGGWMNSVHEYTFHGKMEHTMLRTIHICLVRLVTRAFSTLCEHAP